MAQPIPQALAHLLALNVEFDVLICTQCKFAVTPSAIVRHLRDQHKTDIKLRKQVKEYIQEFPFVYDHITVPLPDENLAPQPIIPVVDGLQCKACLFKSQSKKKIKQHGNTAHNKQRVADEDLYEAVRLQSWFDDRRARYWVVDEAKGQEQVRQTRRVMTRDVGEQTDDDDQGNSQSTHNKDTQDDVDDQIVQDIEKWKAEAQERRLMLLKEVPVVEMDAWLQQTKWNDVLSQSKHDLVKTFHFTRMPDPDEPGLERLLRKWKGILERCLDTLDATDHKDALKWWASPKNEAASQRPFELPQNTQTIEKYSEYFECFICYMLRTAPVDEWTDETETGVKYTEAQWKCIQRIRQELKDHNPESDQDDGPELKNALMCLCMLTIMQDTSRISLYDSPMMHYLAVRGIDSQSRLLRSAFFYTPILAGMLWINRLVMLEVAVPSEAWPALRLQSKAEIESIPDRIHELRQKHLCEGSFSPTASILTQLAMGKKFNKTHQSPSNIHWSDDEQTIHYLGQPVPLAKIETMCQVLIRELKELLMALTFDSPVETVDLTRIVDSMAWGQAFRRQGFSFIEHNANRDQTKGDYRYLLKRARRGDGQWTMLKKKAGSHEVEWVKGQVQAYLTKERQFLRKLMVCMHVTGGQPARGPELGSIKVNNSIYSARNIYIINGRVCFLTMYDKARKRRGNTEYIVRCLSDEVSQTVAQYLIRVRPFARALDKRESEYLFGDMGGPWAGEELSHELSRTTKKHLGVRLTVSGWRHVAIGIATRHLMRASKTWEKEYEDAEDGAEEFAEGGDDEELELDTFRHIMVRQSGHGRRVAQAHYAIDGAFLHRLGPELISAYEQASIAWHGLWELSGKGVDIFKGAGHRREASQALVSRPVKRERIEISDPVLVGLQRIYHDRHARPRSEGQAAALELVHHPSPTQPLVIVLPTSSGKSALFFSVAAMTRQQTVIVVVPFAALVDDIVSRGEAAGLDCEEWVNEQSGHELQQLIIVSADRAVQGEFLHYAKGLELAGQLAHVFFDECHVAFTDTSYRERLRELWTLRYLNCPFTGLTATLMVQLEGVLKERLCIDNAQIFRRSTARKTIRYQVKDSKNEVPSTIAIQYVQQMGLGPGKRGVVYVRSYDTGGVISGALKCPFYRARADDKAGILQQWIDGNGGWIVATGALGTGINIEGIVHIVHVGRPYGLTSFVQQSGRGGRNGEVSESIIITRVENSSGRRRSEILNEYSVEQEDEDAMTAFIQSIKCRRMVLGRYMDGEEEGQGCSQTDGVFCDRCKMVSGRDKGRGQVERPIPKEDAEGEKRSKAEDRFEESGSQIIQHRLQVIEGSQAQMMEVMDELQGSCIYCRLIKGGGHGDEGVHGYRDCRQAEQSGCGYGQFLQWREGVDLGAYQHCWKCGLSQKVCRRLEDDGWCEYPEVMLPSIYVLYQQQHLQGIVEAVGFQGQMEEDVWEWLKGEGEGFGAEWESNWMGTWRMACRIYQMMKGPRVDEE